MPVPINNTFRRMTAAEESSMQISSIYINSQPPEAQMDDTIGPVGLLPTPIDYKIFEEIAELIERAHKYEEEEKEHLRKAEKYEKNIEKTMETLEKAQVKRNALLKKFEFLQNCQQDRTFNKERAVKFWKEYGFDVRQVSSPTDEFQEYEFIYSNLPNAAYDTQDRAQGKTQESKTQTCIIQLKYQEAKFSIVNQMPDIIPPEDLKVLGERLTEACVDRRGEKSDKIDYRLAMLMIRKDLIKALAAPKTSSHLPTETNDHTCT